MLLNYFDCSHSPTHTAVYIHGAAIDVIEVTYLAAGFSEQDARTAAIKLATEKSAGIIRVVSDKAVKDHCGWLGNYRVIERARAVGS